jgi:hypothetical protein
MTLRRRLRLGDRLRTARRQAGFNSGGDAARALGISPPPTTPAKTVPVVQVERRLSHMPEPSVSPSPGSFPAMVRWPRRDTWMCRPSPIKTRFEAMATFQRQALLICKSPIFGHPALEITQDQKAGSAGAPGSTSIPAPHHNLALHSVSPSQLWCGRPQRRGRVELSIRVEIEPV